MGKDLRVEILGDARSYQRALGQASGANTGFGGSLAKMGKIAALSAGVAGLGAIAVTLKAGVGEWVESTKVAAQTGAVLKSTGMAANVTAKQVDDLATSIMNKSGIDDEAIKSGENMLLTFTNIRNEVGKGNDIFSQATKVVADMDTAMSHGNSTAESLSKTSILVGKALNDPIKGMTALSRVGVTFTEAQKKQVKALVESGHAMEAQKLIVRELNKEFGGSAKALGDTLPGQLNILRQSFNNLAGEIVGSFAPALVKGMLAVSHFVQRLSEAKGFKAKISVVVDVAKDAFASVRETINHALFGGVAFGAGGVGPQGIKIDEGYVSKVRDAFAALDWSAVGASIIGGITNALKTAAGLATQLAGTIVEAIRKIPWVEVGRIMGPGLAAAITTAFVTLTDPGFWVKNWDLALAVALVAFGGVFSKIGLRLGLLLRVPMTAAVDSVAAFLGRYSFRLADAFLVGIEKLPLALEAVLVAPLRAVFSRLGAITTFVLKVVGIEAAIGALTQFATGPVWGALTRAFDSVKAAASGIGAFIAQQLSSAIGFITTAALKVALAIVEPFSHLPAFLGGWARDAKDGINRELEKISATKAVAKIIAEQANFRYAGQAAAAAVAGGISGQAGAASAAGKQLGEALMSGISIGLYAALPAALQTAQAAVGRVVAAVTNAAKGSPKYFTYYLGKDLVAQLMQGWDESMPKLAAGAKKGMGTVTQLIIAAAKKYGIDAKAALAVAMTEGGLKFGGPAGDNGKSFGPFQMATFGELSGKTAAQARVFADSADGIYFALRRMNEEGAKGLTGLAAIKQIVGGIDAGGHGFGFERPLHAAAEVAKAWGYFKTLGPEVDKALVSSGATIGKTLQGLAGLVKQYAPTIGIEQARGIIAGLVGKTGDIVAAAKAQMEKVAAAMATAAQASTALKDAFKSMAQGALAAFDEVVAKWKSPSQILLDKMQFEDAINASVKAVADAQTAIDQAISARDTATIQEGETPEAFAARQAELAKAVVDAVAAGGAAERAAREFQLGLTAQQEQIAHDKKVAAEREQLAGSLLQLQTYLAKHPEEYAKVQRQIIALMKKFHVPMQQAGQQLASRFADGFDDGIGAVIATARKLANALEAIPGVGKVGGGGGVGAAGPSRPPDVPGGARQSTIVVNSTTNLDGRVVAENTQKHLLRYGKANGSVGLG